MDGEGPHDEGRAGGNGSGSAATTSDSAATSSDNVIRFPRNWFGPTDELVPFGPSATRTAISADDFWSEDSAAIQNAIQAPERALAEAFEPTSEAGAEAFEPTSEAGPDAAARFRGIVSLVVRLLQMSVARFRGMLFLPLRWLQLPAGLVPRLRFRPLGILRGGLHARSVIVVAAAFGLVCAALVLPRLGPFANGGPGPIPKTGGGALEASSRPFGAAQAKARTLRIIGNRQATAAHERARSHASTARQRHSHARTGKAVQPSAPYAAPVQGIPVTTSLPTTGGSSGGGTGGAGTTSSQEAAVGSSASTAAGGSSGASSAGPVGPGAPFGPGHLG